MYNILSVFIQAPYLVSLELSLHHMCLCSDTVTIRYNDILVERKRRRYIDYRYNELMI